MPTALHFTGHIPGVSYTTKLDEKLDVHTFDNFDINTVKPYGLIETPETIVAYSRWVSPKRTRSYPFERIYNTYNAAKRLTVIPVIKDEGRDGDLDRIQFSTMSWMNLLNVHIVLGYYETARKNSSTTQRHRQKLTGQSFNNEFIKTQISEIIRYKRDALHWNIDLFENRFTEIFERALIAYQKISVDTEVEIHEQSSMLSYLERIKAEYTQFRTLSLRASQLASNREIATTHLYEFLEDGAKATFYIENYLGGVYHLTADEVVFEHGKYVIQESKHASRGSLPSVADIKDGLFKLILFSNLKTLYLEGQSVEFASQLKLTGTKLKGRVALPATSNEVDDFIEVNRSVLTKRQREIIKLLGQETIANPDLRVLIKGSASEADENFVSDKKFVSDKEFVKSPLRYPGGKSKALAQIIERVPSEFREYREPFVGGGSMFLYLRQRYPRLPIWINDLNADVISFWCAVQSDVHRLVAEVKRIKQSVRDGRKLFVELTGNYEHDLTGLERAVRFFVLNRITFSGTVDSGGYSQKAFETRFTDSSIRRLAALEGTLDNVKITNLDYRDVINAEGENCFLFLDPPYSSSVKSKLYGRRGCLHEDFNHREFAASLRGCAHKWLVTYNDSKDIKESFAFARCDEWELQYGMNNFGRSFAPRGRELFITNYAMDVVTDAVILHAAAVN